MNENANPGALHKNGAAKNKAVREAAVSPREVARALATDEESRVLAMATFRAAGGSLDTWRRNDRAVMADAITRAEGALDLRRTTKAADTAKTALREVRRRLEWEVWP